MRIYFGTNRNPNRKTHPDDFGTDFSPAGNEDMRYGWAEVDDGDPEKFSLFVAPEKLDIGLEKALRGDFSGQVFGSRKVFEEIKQEMLTHHQDCMIYIHGFNYTFQEAVTRVAQLKKFYNARPMTWFLFSWPSQGDLWLYKPYLEDRDMARKSAKALARGMMKLLEFLRQVNRDDQCGQLIHLMAHSMGNYALRLAFVEMRKMLGNRVPRVFDQILMIAADEDSDTFEHEHKLKLLPDMAHRITVYHNPADLALMISDKTKGNPDRLGADGPSNSRLVPDKVTFVNCRKVTNLIEDVQLHQYYRLNDTVRDDMLMVLKGVENGEIPGRILNPETRGYFLK